MTGKQMAFGWSEEPDGYAGAPGGIRPLADRLRRLAERGVYLGTSSWKYPGWLGKVYSPDRYVVRGKISSKRFNDTCLEQYARLFPTVCGDFVFYQFPTESTWQRTLGELPEHYRFSMKIPEDVTVERFPDLPRYGRRAGTANAHFMHAGLVRNLLLNRLEPYREKLGVLIFEFGTIHDGPMSEPHGFAGALDKMLAELPTDRYRFAVEVRNPSFLTDAGSPYLDTLRAHNVAHCLNSWTRMPSLAEQLKIENILTASHTAVRCLLKPGRTYKQAVAQFEPYERIQDPYPEGRSALRELIDSFIPGENALYAFVNNRFEGNAIDTIDLATEGL